MSADQTGPADFSGGCLCGKVRYRSRSAPGVVANCHCVDCQRQTGSAFSTIAGVSAADFEMSGESARYATQGESGARVHRHFCSTCGSPVFSVVEATPGLIWVKTGTIDGPPPSPQIQLWWCAAQPWLEGLAPTLPRFSRNATSQPPADAEAT